MTTTTHKCGHRNRNESMKWWWCVEVHLLCRTPDGLPVRLPDWSDAVLDGRVLAPRPRQHSGPRHLPSVWRRSPYWPGVLQSGSRGLTHSGIICSRPSMLCWFSWFFWLEYRPLMGSVSYKRWKMLKELKNYGATIALFYAVGSFDIGILLWRPHTMFTNALLLFCRVFFLKECLL